jgi:hypothetical protein
MEIIYGIMLLAVIIGLVIAWEKFKEYSAEKLSQSVFQRREHREGQELVSQKLVFSAHASVDDVRTAVLSTVKIAPNVPPVIADAHLIKATDEYILYGFGNKLNPHNFRGLLSFDETEDGVRGSWEIVNWTLGDGIVAGQSVMKRLVADINTALRSVDPNARLR